MFTAKAKLIYDPKDNAAKRKGFQFWWLIATVHPSIAYYYRELVRRETGDYLNDVLWKSHISVIRGEEPRKTYLWKKYEGRQVEFTYSPLVRVGPTYYWLTVESPELEAIRVELGLRPQPRVAFHLTIGNNKNIAKEKKDVIVPFKLFPWERPEVVDKLWRKPQK